MKIVRTLKNLQNFQKLTGAKEKAIERGDKKSWNVLMISLEIHSRIQFQYFYIQQEELE